MNISNILYHLVSLPNLSLLNIIPIDRISNPDDLCQRFLTFVVYSSNALITKTLLYRKEFSSKYSKTSLSGHLSKLGTSVNWALGEPPDEFLLEMNLSKLGIGHFFTAPTVINTSLKWALFFSKTKNSLSLVVLFPSLSLSLVAMDSSITDFFQKSWLYWSKWIILNKSHHKKRRMCSTFYPLSLTLCPFPES